MKTLVFRLLLLLIVVTCTGIGLRAQAAAQPTPDAADDIYLAKDDGSGKAGDAATTFRPTDIPIYCVVILDSTNPVTVKLNLVAVSVKGVKPETKVVTTSYTTRDGQNRVNFTGKPDREWTVGQYRADIFIDGKLVRNVKFEISDSGPTNAAASFFTPPVKKESKPKRTMPRN